MKTVTKFTVVLLFLFIGNTCFSQQRFWSNIWQSSTVQGKNYLGSWEFKDSQKYLNGDFDGDGNDELLIIKAPYAMLQRYGTRTNPPVTTTTWYSIWSNGGYGNLSPGAALNNSDKYVVGDFDGDGIDELLSITDAYPAPSYVSIFKYSTTLNNWTRVYYSTSGKIGNWTINYRDTYFAGLFYANRYYSLKSETLLCISSDGKAAEASVHVSNGSYSFRSEEITNTGNIGGVPLSNIVATGYFTQGNYEELLAVSRTSVAILGGWNSSQISLIWQTPVNATTFGGWEFTNVISDSKAIVAANYETGSGNNDDRDEILFISNGFGGPNLNKASLIKNTTPITGGNYIPIFNNFWNNGGNGTMDGTNPFISYPSTKTQYLPIKYKDLNGRTRYRLLETSSIGTYIWDPAVGGYVSTPSAKAYMYEFNSYYLYFGSSPGISQPNLTPEPEVTGTKLSGNNTGLAYTLAPNPSQEFVNIQRTVSDNPSHYQIYDMLGKKLKEGFIAEGEYTQKIDLSGFKAGTYMIRLQDGDTIITEKIFVK